MRYRLMLNLMFFLSGFASLIYQVVWQRLLTLHYGVGAISTTLIVTVYMVGLGFGGLLGGFLAESVRDRTRLYAIVELSLGFYGLISLSLIGFIGTRMATGHYVWSFCFMWIFLTIPTLFMGMTLPIMTKVFHQLVQDFFQTISSLYFVNSLGAAAGAICAGYVIISFFGLDLGIYVASAINFCLGVMMLHLRKRGAGTESETPHTRGPTTIVSRRVNPVACSLVFVSGLLAIGYEIIWFRVIGILGACRLTLYSLVRLGYERFP